MKKYFSMFIAAAAMVIATGPALAITSSVYDALPSVSPSTNYPSLGYQATSTKEFGDHVTLAGVDRVLKTITVTMSDWAMYASYSTDTRYMGDSAKWTHPVTLNIYSVNHGSPNTVGTLLGTVTQSINIPWRPAEDPINCPTKSSSGYAYKFQAVPGPVDTNCMNGLAFNAVFDFGSLNLTLPEEVVVGVAYNTNTWGYSPIGQGGPYESLNVAIPENQIVSVGSDYNSDNVFWNSTYGGRPVGFTEDTGWTPNGTLALKIEAGPVLVAPPTNKAQCKKDGWKIFNNPSFKNQGDCVSYVEKNKKEDSEEKGEKNREKEKGNKNKESEHDNKEND